MTKVIDSTLVVGEYHGGAAKSRKFVSYCRSSSFATMLYECQFNLREKMIGKC